MNNQIEIPRSLEIFQELENLQNSICEFLKKVDAIELITPEESQSLSDEANQIIALCDGEYGEYTYLFEATGNKFRQSYNDLLIRMKITDKSEDL
ncbi:hypothetical protein [Methylobacter sp. BlB1]|jgi:hypothetical protein|uniref:hypothetical protein n=1 Tax=Methylobacter sp. BlB1 TaxID=2785914 RepID=UPI00189605F3|nr:hypothetical protein [Methylobacter sp. BlB1]MBF6649173.1 hypothetical protein [Methylobacter sp. BlB1]